VQLETRRSSSGYTQGGNHEDVEFVEDDEGASADNPPQPQIPGQQARKAASKKAKQAHAASSEQLADFWKSKQKEKKKVRRNVSRALFTNGTGGAK
jgi:hypothetical protein